MFLNNERMSNVNVRVWIGQRIERPHSLHMGSVAAGIWRLKNNNKEFYTRHMQTLGDCCFRQTDSWLPVRFVPNRHLPSTPAFMFLPNTVNENMPNLFHSPLNELWREKKNVQNYGDWFRYCTALDTSSVANLTHLKFWIGKQIDYSSKMANISTLMTYINKFCVHPEALLLSGRK
jgi:hypothetical protein